MECSISGKDWADRGIAENRNVPVSRDIQESLTLPAINVIVWHGETLTFRDEAYEFQLYTEYILKRLDEIGKYVKDISREAFLRSGEQVDHIFVQADIIHHFIQLIPSDVKSRYPEICWNSFPAVLSNPPAALTPDAAWSIAAVSAPRLKAEIAAVKERLDRQSASVTTA